MQPKASKEVEFNLTPFAQGLQIHRVSQNESSLSSGFGDFEPTNSSLLNNPSSKPLAGLAFGVDLAPISRLMLLSFFLFRSLGPRYDTVPLAKFENPTKSEEEISALLLSSK